jgi:hypothetical protein
MHNLCCYCVFYFLIWCISPTLLRSTRRNCGDANNNFLTFLFSEYATGVKFLKGVGILRSKVQWVFGGVERESGKTFLVPVPDRTADILVNVICAWIELGTSIISDCWAVYKDSGSLGYTHRTVNHSVSFVNPDTGVHTNTIVSM